jgi:hypothetical protein
MPNDIDRLVEATGISVHVAAQIVSIVLDSGASDMEVRAALKIVDAVLVTLPISSRPEGLRAP